MADLAQLQSGVNVTGYQTKALNLGQDAPAALPPDTSRLSAAQGHAALMGTVAKTLSELPNLILGNYMKGKQIPTQLKANEALAGVLGGKAPNLPEGTSVTPDGVTYKAPDPNAAALNDLKRQETLADIEYKKARTSAMGEGGKGMQENPLSAAFGAAPGSPLTLPGESEPPSGETGALSGETGEQPSGGVVQGDEDKPLGVGTSYGYTKDKYGGSKAAASTTGPAGNKLDSESLAVSPDIEKHLLANGYKFGDRVMMQTPSGPVSRRWDDRTAQWDSTGKWSVDSSGRYISKVDARHAADLPEDERLPALTGRFDFHAGSNGKPSGYNGVKIVGIAPKNGALSGGGEPALPTNGATQPQGALADPGQPLMPRGGAPEGSTPPEPSTAPEAAAVAPDGTLNPEAAISATGGKKMTDQGHAGGVVTRFAGFDKEETEDGTVYLYPHKIKPGQKPFTVFKKPMHYTADTTKLASAAGYAPKPGETEASVAANSRAALNEAERVPPDARPVFMRWGSSLQSNPVVKEFYTARHQKDVVEAALSKGLTPAAALGVIDAYVKAMRGGAATQGMTRILEDAQPVVQQLKLKWQKITGGAGENAVLTKEMAEDVRHILGRIETASRKEVEGMKDGDKEYLSTIGIPAGAVEKTYKRILTGAKTSVEGLDVSPNGEAPAPTNPAAIQSQKAAKAKEVKANYDAGKYQGADKERAEALLRANGLLGGQPPAAKPAAKPPANYTGAIEG